MTWCEIRRPRVFRVPVHYVNVVVVCIDGPWGTVEFHMDDTQAHGSKDALVEMSFYVPPTSAEWGVEPDEEHPENTGAKRLQEAILEVADTEVGG